MAVVAVVAAVAQIIILEAIKEGIIVKERAREEAGAGAGLMKTKIQLKGRRRNHKRSIKIKRAARRGAITKIQAREIARNQRRKIKRAASRASD